MFNTPKLCAALAFAAMPMAASAATMTIDLDATTNLSAYDAGAAGVAAGVLVEFVLPTDQVFSIEVIDGTYQAYRFGDNPIDCVAVDDCGDGWTVNYNVWDATGTGVTGFGIPGTYATAAEALGVAQDAGARTVAATAGTYYFGIGDRIDSGGDNSGGVSLRISYESPSEIPLPASALLLLGGLAGLSVIRRRG